MGFKKSIKRDLVLCFGLCLVFFHAQALAKSEPLTQIEYLSDSGLPQKTILPDGRAMTFDYGELPLPKQITYPEQTIKYAYDEWGNRILTHDRSGRIYVLYDSRHRPMAIFYRHEPSKLVTVKYSPHGFILDTVIYDLGLIGQDRDLSPLLKQIYKPKPGDPAWEAQRYDALYQLKMAVEKEMRFIQYRASYRYDGLGRMLALNAGELQVRFNYSDFLKKREVRRQLGDHIQSVFRFDPRGRATRITHRVHGKLLSEYQYEYHPTGQLKKEIIKEAGQAQQEIAYQFDKHGTLAQYGLNNQLTTLTYDQHRRLAGIQTRQSNNRYQYDLFGRISAYGAEQYSRIKNGHINAIHTGKTRIDIQYNTQGLPVKLSSGESRREYTWDPDGALIYEKHGQEHAFYFNNPIGLTSTPLLETNQHGSIKSSYFYAGGLVGQYHKDHQWRYYLSSANGKVRFVLSEKGKIISHLGYSPLGDIHQIQGKPKHMPKFVAAGLRCFPAEKLFLQNGTLRRQYAGRLNTVHMPDPAVASRHGGRYLREAWALIEANQNIRMLSEEESAARERYWTDGGYKAADYYQGMDQFLSATPYDDFLIASFVVTSGVRLATYKNPRIEAFLVNEIFSGLDPIIRNKLHERGQTYFVEKIADRASGAISILEWWDISRSVWRSGSDLIKKIKNNKNIDVLRNTRNNIKNWARTKNRLARELQGKINDIQNTLNDLSKEINRLKTSGRPKNLSAIYQEITRATSLNVSLNKQLKVLKSLRLNDVMDPILKLVDGIEDLFRLKNKIELSPAMMPNFRQSIKRYPRITGTKYQVIIDVAKASIHSMIFSMGGLVTSLREDHGEASVDSDNKKNKHTPESTPWFHINQPKPPELQEGCFRAGGIDSKCLDDTLYAPFFFGPPGSFGGGTSSEPHRDGPGGQSDALKYVDSLSNHVPVDDPFKSVDKTIGGIRLDKAADYNGIPPNLAGAVYYPDTQELVLLGDQTVKAPGVSPADLAIALYAAYSGIEQLQFSLDPADPKDPHGKWLKAVYHPRDLLFGSGFGNTLYEADWLMKQYAFGVSIDDNHKMTERQSSVPAYQAYREALMNRDTASGKAQWTRYWILLDEIIIKSTPQGFVFEKATMKIAACKQTPDPNSRSGLKDLSCGQENYPIANHFKTMFSQHYDAFAAESPAFAHVRELAKAFALAKWMKKAGVKLDPAWVERYINERTTSVDRVTALSVSWNQRKETPFQKGNRRGVNIVERTVKLFGGVQLKVEPKPVADDGPVKSITQRIATLDPDNKKPVFFLEHEDARYQAATPRLAKGNADLWQNYKVKQKDDVIYVLNNKSQIVEETATNGKRLQFNYQPNGKLHSVRFQSPSGHKIKGVKHKAGATWTVKGAGKEDLHYTYNPKGKLASIKRGDTTLANLRFDANKNETTIQYPDHTERFGQDESPFYELAENQTHGNKLRIQYTKNHQPKSMSLNNQKLFSASYHSDGKLSNLSLLHTKYDFEYHRNGRLASFKQNNGDARIYEYDQNDQLKTLRTNKQDFSYTYEKTGAGSWHYSDTAGRKFRIQLQKNKIKHISENNQPWLKIHYNDQNRPTSWHFMDGSNWTRTYDQGDQTRITTTRYPVDM